MILGEMYLLQMQDTAIQAQIHSLWIESKVSSLQHERRKYELKSSLGCHGNPINELDLINKADFHFRRRVSPFPLFSASSSSFQKTEAGIGISSFLILSPCSVV